MIGENSMHTFYADPLNMYVELVHMVKKFGCYSNSDMSAIIEEGMRVKTNRKDEIIGFSLDFTKLVLGLDTEKKYEISMKETVNFAANDNLCKVSKFSNQIRNKDDFTDYFRFDFVVSDEYPNYHINADEDKFGVYHLIFGTHTNLDIKKTNPLKTLKIFLLYVKSRKHPLIEKENAGYVKILEEGE